MSKPALKQPALEVDSAQAERYGCFLGGPESLDLSHLIGEFHVGHPNLPRRELIQFADIRVGASISSIYGEHSLNPLHNSDKTMLEWSKNKERIKTKSARECLLDVLATHGREGFTALKCLQAKSFSEADKIFNIVLPVEVAATTLPKVITYLEDIGFPEDTTEFQLRQELLAAAYRCREHYNLITTAIKNEINNAGVTGLGLKSLDPAMTAVFLDMGLDLPAEAQKKQTVEMGQAIAAAVAPHTSTSKVEELLAAVVEQNALLRAEQKETKKRLAKLEGKE